MNEEEEILYCQKLLVMVTEKEEIIEEGEPETVIENKDIDICCENVFRVLEDVHGIRDEVTYLKNRSGMGNKANGSPSSKHFTESMRIHKQETQALGKSTALYSSNTLALDMAEIISEKSHDDDSSQD